MKDDFVRLEFASGLFCACRFKVAISDLEPGKETDLWVELEPSDHKKHIRNHSEFHENLDQKKKRNYELADYRQRHKKKRRNSDPPVVSDSASNATRPKQGREASQEMNDDNGRDAFKPMHARRSRYTADGSMLSGVQPILSIGQRQYGVVLDNDVIIRSTHTK